MSSCRSACIALPDHLDDAHAEVDRPAEITGVDIGLGKVAIEAAQVSAVADVDGVEVYSYLRGEGSSYGYFAVFTDMASMQAASQTEAMQAAMGQFGALLDGPPNMVMGEALSAKGFEV
jgi:quinol monooxygenase YgiN